SPLIYLLIVAAVVTTLLGEHVDTGVIVAVLLLNAVIGYTQESKAEASVQALMQLAAPRARVVRDGQEREVEAIGLVPGDLVLLESGSRVPADLRLLSARSLEVDESLLTGESTAVRKHAEPIAADTATADRANVAFMGSSVVAGRGRGLVGATGTGTELGKIAEQVRTEEQPTTPLQQRMGRFANLIAVLVVAAAALSFALGLAVGEPAGEMLMLAVALAVAVVPEGLPVVLTVALALGVRRMASRQALIRRLPAVETLGSTTTIGSDKTGTLTENRMVVTEAWTFAGVRAIDGEVGAGGAREAGDGHGLEDGLRTALLAGVLANEAQLYRADGETRTEGDPTEVALLLSASRLGLDPGRARRRAEVHLELPFESDRRFSAVVADVDGDPGDRRVLVKGAPERVLEMCAAAEGAKALDRDAVLDAAGDMAARGLRVLAMAHGPVEAIPTDDRDLAFAGLTLAGLQGMLDPPRQGVPGAIRACADAGIRVCMITGDHPETGLAIARDIGIAEEGDRVVTGAELERLNDDELDGLVEDVGVYARVAPDHKLRIVKSLQRRGHTTAVTGDGVNDAPALKAADIGVAMGRDGTDVAREASDMVLTDDDFTSIVAAVEEGRVTFDNVRKVTFFLVSTGLAAIVALLATVPLGLALPFVPAQLLWLNVVTNGLQDLALAFERGEEGVLRRPPRRREEGLVSGLLWERAALVGVVMAILTLVLFDWQLGRTGSIEQARTVALSTMVVCMGVHLLNARSLRRSLFRTPLLANRFLLVAQVLALGVHVGALYLPATQFVLRVEPIDATAWGSIVLASLSMIVVNEAHKLLRPPTDA
ncbi:MAG: cation-translocating P-type ATPase, partial [Actinomycetota bacterium]